MQERRLLPLILPLIFFSLLAGIWAGWIRIGWEYPLTLTAGRHGAIMVGSFLGTLINLERAVVIKNKWAILVPILSGSSIIFFMLEMDYLAFSALTLSSLGQVIMMGYFLSKHNLLYLKVMLTGSICWFIGNLIWLRTGLYPLAAVWWIAFLLFIITGERLELSRFLPLKKNKIYLLVFSLGLFLMGIIIPFHGDGRYLAGAGLILIGTWLLKYDMARKSIKIKGQHRFSAILLLTGYAWMIISGIMILLGDLYGFIYDAVLHTFFIGFVFSMIFAHGPIILPGVLGQPIKPFHIFLYFPAILLQISLLLRVVTDIYSWSEIRKWGGMFNGIAILLFFMAMAVLIVQEKRKLSQAKK